MDKVLSIIVPSYNMEKYLSKCLGSLVVAPELMECLEVLVVNDGSKDRTSEIAHEFAAKWPQTFKVIDKGNGHYGSCVNAGIKIAHGEFVKIIDADDSVESRNFENWMWSVRNGICDGTLTCVDLLVTDFCTVNLIDNVTERCKYRVPRNKVFDARVLNPEYIFMMHSLAWRRLMLVDHGYHQTEGVMYTDGEWAVYPLAWVRNIYYNPVVVYKYSIGREGQSMDPNVKRNGIRDMAVVFATMYRKCMEEDSSRIKDRYLSVIFRMIGGYYNSMLDCGNSVEAVKGVLALDDIVGAVSPELCELMGRQSLINKIRRAGRIGRFDLLLFRVRRRMDRFCFGVVAAFRCAYWRFV